MKRFLLALALVVAATAASAPGVAEAQYGYYGTYRGVARNVTNGHVRSMTPPGNVFIQSYAPPAGYGYYGEGYGPAVGYGPGGYGPGYGYGPGCDCRQQNGYAPYGYGGYPPGRRW